MTIRAIIFDLYGVLGMNGWQAFKLEHFANKPEAWERLRTLGQRVDAGEISDSKLVEAVAQATGASKEKVRYQFEHTVANEALLDHIARKLKPQYKIGLLSNASQDVLGDVFTPEQLALFDEAISSFHVGLTKPNPAMFRLMCEELGVSPAECIIVDDQRRHLDAAAKLGMKPVLYESVSQVEAAIERAIAR